MTSKLTRERVVALIAEHSYDSALVDALEHLLAAMDSEPVAWMNKGGTVLNVMRKSAHDFAHYNIPLYRHAQPAPVVPDAATAIRACLSEFPESARDIVEECADIAENACRAAMLQAKSLTSINPAPTLVSLPKNAKSLTGNSPVIGIDLASGPDRTVEVHYVVPPGYVVVPKEPTDEMIAAAMNCKDVLFNSDDSFCIQFVNIYEAMLAAAPKEVK